MNIHMATLPRVIQIQIAQPRGPEMGSRGRNQGRPKHERKVKLMKNRSSLKIFTTVLSVLACCAFLQTMQAQLPPEIPGNPDGCYPAFTTAEGCNALHQLLGGIGNTAVGWYSNFLAGDASFNTSVGAGTLALTSRTGAGTDGNSNTAVGTAAMILNLSGSQNVAVGTNALVNNLTGSGNNAVGSFALYNNDSSGLGHANGNNAFGNFALTSNVDGTTNSAFGDAALFSNINARENTAIGNAALFNNDSSGNGFASFNTAVGTGALFSNTDGGSNTAVGAFALASNDTGNSNTAVGVSALPVNVSGIENTAIGGAALFTNEDGSHNVAVGQAALSNNTHGSNNVAVGEFAGLAVTTSNNVICIGDNVQGQDLSDSCFIGNIFNAMSPSGSAVFIDANNRLGTITSSKRFKEEIEPMDEVSGVLFTLKPVTFRYKKEIDPAGTQQLGLVAEDVEKVNPNLVVRDKEGKPYSVRYDQVNAMLLNEFLKEHRKVEKLEATVAEQQASFQSKLAEQEKQ